MEIAPLIIISLITLTLFYFGFHLLFSRNGKSYSKEINAYLYNQSLTFKSKRKAQKSDWKEGPFPKPPALRISAGTFTIMGISVPVTDDQYWIIETNEEITVWLRIETTLFSRPELTFKEKTRNQDKTNDYSC